MKIFILLNHKDTTNLLMLIFSSQNHNLENFINHDMDTIIPKKV